MRKRILLMGLGLIAMIIVGCGQVAQQTGGNEAGNNSQVQISESVIASSKIKISMTQGGGMAPSSVETNTISTQSVEIEANVPDFMTFDAQSSIFFNVNQMGMIVADGVITLDVKYNDLLADTLQDVKVRAYMLSGDGLTGQTKAHVIPLDIELVSKKPYAALTETETDMKVWSQPFDQAINEILVFKLRGDFSHAFNQLYKGTVILDFVRNDEQDLQEGLISNYALNGNAIDEVSTVNNGTVAGYVLPTTDRFGNTDGAMSFSGNYSNYISVPYTCVNSLGQGTVSAWVKLNELNKWQYVIDKTTPYVKSHFSLGIDNNNLVTLFVDGTENPYFQSNTELTTGIWYHIAATWDGSDWKCYVNGVLENQITSNRVVQDVVESTYIGRCAHNQSDGALNGSIDGLRIYDRALSESEISVLYSLNN